LSSAFVELFTAKGVLETVLETPNGELTVFNLHLHMPSWVLGRNVRLRQMKRAVEVLGKQTGPAILAGDFNEDKLCEQPEFTAILEAARFSSPSNLGKEMLPTYRLENEFVDIWINRDHAPSCFDYVFTRSLEDLDLHVVSYEPVYLTPALSDHDPITLTLSSR
jgi:endonuclease/exonuclease/phosphatase family metal-dependent hydrolase